jgi:hypothetical protein
MRHWLQLSVVAFGSVLVLILGACASDPGPQRGPETDGYQGVAPYGYGTYPRRQYGPWDMPGSQMQPGPPTWYGCPQQSARCYPD